MDNDYMKNRAEATEMFLARISPMDVMNRISNFRKKNIKNLTDEELHAEIYNVLMINNLFVYITNGGAYPANTPFFRVRKLNCSVIGEMNFTSLSDFWEPPQRYVERSGRLNKVGESLLYTSPSNPNVAISEMHLNENDWYALIKYTALKEIKVNIIGGKYDYKQLGFTNEKAILIHELFNSFLRDEFSREVGEGTEHLYRVSEKIAKDFFDLPREVQDGWCYSSVQDKQQYNVCFRPDAAHELLTLNGAMICKAEKDNSIRPRCVALPSKITGKVEFYPLGSEQQRIAFPEIEIYSDI